MTMSKIRRTSFCLGIILMLAVVLRVATAQGTTLAHAQYSSLRWARVYAACGGPYWRCGSAAMPDCREINVHARWYQAQWVCTTTVFRYKRHIGGIFGNARAEACAVAVGLNPYSIPLSKFVTCNSISQNNRDYIRKVK